MNQDYKNFGERMGSFEDTMDVSGEELVHDTLSHFGILGMRWGRRKSRGNDNGLIIKNVKFKVDEETNNSKHKEKTTDKNAKSKPNNENTKKDKNTDDGPSTDKGKVVSTSAKTGINTVALGRSIVKSKLNAKHLKKASQMSDEELKNITNRLELENRYMNATTQKASRSRVEGILATTGAAFSVAASAAMMYEAIKKAKG